jgi:hypothetical protein
MDVKDLADEKRRLEFRLCKEIREFEQKTEMQVTGIKFNRFDDQAIESVTLKVEMRD